MSIDNEEDFSDSSNKNLRNISKDELEEKESKPYEELTMRFPLTSCLSISPLKIRKDKDDNVIPLSAYELGEQIIERVPIAKAPNNSLYYYNKGVYLPNGIQAVEELIIQLMQHAGIMSKWKADYVGLVVKYITTVVPTLWEKPVEDKINLLNGIFDIIEWKLIPHTHKYLSTVQLPIQYNKDAVCYGMEKFVREVFPEDARHIAWEIMAWVITSNNKAQNMIILNGSGSNGKSTFLIAIENLLGKENVSHVSLQRLEIDRFAPARLYQKLANICADLPNTKLTSTLVFKSITGGDYVEIEFKNKDSFPGILFSKLLFSTNELPRTVDTSEGFYRKIKIVPFNATFHEDARKSKELAEMITDPYELSGMLNNALEVLPSVLVNGVRVAESMKEAQEEFREATDPLIDWIIRNIEDKKGSYISKSELYQRYKDDCRLDNISAKSKKAVGVMIKKMRPNVREEFIKDDNDKTVRVWLGIVLLM